ncbi:MAG: hypothetical protein IPL71_01790 [Anaerolineales bacterium]|uniref:hypothetical protein n=1 Tax=Candidatus Villigracilis proximus TaxID=3140683 RepID=UPI00313597CB|nr:hypothetical protein [Anaerolineales bacterium]
MPLTFAVGWNIFSKRLFIFSLASLFVVKLVFFSFLPQTGLGVYAFTSEEAVLADQWDRSYYTYATPGYTQVINRPYYALREFPVEWINNRFGFDKNQFWLKLELSGYINLQQNERLVFVTQGAKQIQAELLDVSTQKTVPSYLLSGSKTLTANFTIPSPNLVKSKFKVRSSSIIMDKCVWSLFLYIPMAQHNPFLHLRVYGHHWMAPITP